MEKKETQHWSSCAVHNEPAYPNGECDCGGITIVSRFAENARRLVYSLGGLLGMFHLESVRNKYRLHDSCPTPASLLYRVRHRFAKQQASQHCWNTHHMYAAAQSDSDSYGKTEDSAAL